MKPLPPPVATLASDHTKRAGLVALVQGAILVGHGVAILVAYLPTSVGWEFGFTAAVGSLHIVLGLPPIGVGLALRRGRGGGVALGIEIAYAIVLLVLTFVQPQWPWQLPAGLAWLAGIVVIVILVQDRRQLQAATAEPQATGSKK